MSLNQSDLNERREEVEDNVAQQLWGWVQNNPAKTAGTFVGTAAGVTALIMTAPVSLSVAFGMSFGHALLWGGAASLSTKAADAVLKAKGNTKKTKVEKPIEQRSERIAKQGQDGKITKRSKLSEKSDEDNKPLHFDFSLPSNLGNVGVQPLAPVSSLQFLLAEPPSEPVEVPAQLPEIGLKRKRKQQDEQNGVDALNGFDSSEEIANRAILLALKHYEEQKPFVANNGQTMEVVEFAQTEDNTDVSFDKPDIF